MNETQTSRRHLILVCVVCVLPQHAVALAAISTTWVKVRALDTIQFIDHVLK